MTTNQTDTSTSAPEPSGGSPTAGPARLRPKAIRARRNRRLLMVALLVLLTTIGYLVFWWTHDRHWVKTDNPSTWNMTSRFWKSGSSRLISRKYLRLSAPVDSESYKPPRLPEVYTGTLIVVDLLRLR